MNNKSTAASSSWKEREDVKGLAVGFLFTLSLTFLIDLNAYKLERFSLFPDQGYFWYFWILSEPTFWTRLSAWGPYFCHQVLHWYLIYHGQKYVRSPTTKLQPVHYACFALNGVFSILKFVQTHTMYDGLAQEFKYVIIPQIAVIIMLIWILLIENKRRGLIFGKPAPFLSNDLIHFAKKYHGYYFSWAIVGSLWFHPMEGTNGHLWGFFYTLLLMVQGSLFLTRVHMNKWWTVCLELLVTPHGVLVALGQAFNAWRMFLSGFLFMFVLTQMHGLGLPVILKRFITLIFALLCFLMYSGLPFNRLNEPFRIPFIDYVGLYILAIVLYAIMWCCRRSRQ